MEQLDALRKLCFALPETTERLGGGGPDRARPYRLVAPKTLAASVNQCRASEVR
ncbi:hypothetical protein [Amycolatopsis sp. lyj-109]|uniref:hypothetical protein n=1 Tax=Amycolatopsis sp. lyj-109 TaxID=2789287 RepID=UPI00397A7B77